MPEILRQHNGTEPFDQSTYLYDEELKFIKKRTLELIANPDLTPIAVNSELRQILGETSRSSKKGNIPWQESVNPETGMFPIEERWLEELHKATGYLNDEERLFLDTAVRLGLLAFACKYRHSSHPYSDHLFEVTTSLAKNHKPDVTTLAAAFNHDDIEDTWVKEDELKAFLGEGVTNIVSDLSKHKSRWQRHEIANEGARIKTLKSLVDNPRTVFIKIYDRIANMRTLQYILTREKRLRIINETETIYIPLAEIVGLHAEAEELRELCLRNRSKRRWDDIQRKHRNITKTLETEGVTIHTSPEITRNNIDLALAQRGIRARVIFKPPAYKDIYDYGDFRLHFDVVLTTETSSKPLAWGEQAMAIVNFFYWNANYLPVDSLNEMEVRHDIVSKLIDSVNFQILQKNGHQIPISISIFPHDIYRSENVDLGKLYDVRDKKAQSIARVKHELIRRRLNEAVELTGNNGKSNTILRRLSPQILPTHQWVIGIDKDGNEQLWSIPKNSTLMEYIVDISSAGWFRAKQVFVNGKEVSFNYQLKPRDKVHVVFSDTDNWDPFWLHCLPPKSKAWNTTARHVMDKLSHSEKESTYLRILEVGKWKLEQYLDETARPLWINPQRIIGLIQESLGDQSLTEDQFLFAVGMNQVDNTVLLNIADALALENNQVGKIKVIFRPNQSGQEAAIASILYELDINHIGSTAGTLGEGTSFIEIVVNQEDKTRINELVKAINGDPNCLQVGLQQVFVG